MQTELRIEIPCLENEETQKLILHLQFVFIMRFIKFSSYHPGRDRTFFHPNGFSNSKLHIFQLLSIRHCLTMIFYPSYFCFHNILGILTINEMKFLDNFYYDVNRIHPSYKPWLSMAVYWIPVSVLFRKDGRGCGLSGRKADRQQEQHFYWITSFEYLIIISLSPTQFGSCYRNLWEKDEKWFFQSMWRWLMIWQNKFLLSFSWTLKWCQVEVWRDAAVVRLFFVWLCIFL